MGVGPGKDHYQRERERTRSQGKPSHQLRTNTLFPKGGERSGDASTLVLQIMHANRSPADKNMLSVEGYIEREAEFERGEAMQALRTRQESEMFLTNLASSLSEKKSKDDDDDASGAKETGQKQTPTRNHHPGEGKTVDSLKFCTPKRHPSPDPVWNYTVDLGMAPAKGDILHLSVTKGSENASRPVAIGAFDLETLPRDTVITKTLVPVSRNVDTTEKLLLECAGTDPKKACTITFKILKTLKSGARVYFVRHGESKWNQARREKNYRKLIHFDHILTFEGIQQSYHLHEFWTDQVKKNPADPELTRFLNADMILSSPLTRALQTCLISLKDHPTAKSKGVTLCRDLREIKTLGGFDAKGKCFGPAIMTRTEEKLIKKIKEANTLGDVSENQVKRYLEMAKEACKTKIDYNDANTQWWVLKDTKSDVKERLEDFLSYIRYCPGNTFICVGHSMFLKALFTHCLSKEWSARHPQVAQNLKTEKLTNAGCVAADFTFRGSSKEWEITEAKLLFETGFQFRRTRSHSPGGSRSPRNGKRSERLLSDGSEALALSGRRKPAGGGGVSRNVSSTRSSPLPEDESKHR